ncbi:Uncharacterised protein [Chlamydia abortus]|nr:Uncharacterised protein [Chlamydia abortus]
MGSISFISFISISLFGLCLKFLVYVSIAALSISEAYKHILSGENCSIAILNPPIPANKSTNVKFFFNTDII